MFYGEIGKSKTEVKQFWIKIWSNEKEHNAEVDLIERKKERLDEVKEQK